MYFLQQPLTFFAYCIPPKDIITFKIVTKFNLLQEEVNRAEILAQSEISRLLPDTSSTEVNEMLIELKEKINNRKTTIQTSKIFIIHSINCIKTNYPISNWV